MIAGGRGAAYRWHPSDWFPKLQLNNNTQALATGQEEDDDE